MVDLTRSLRSLRSVELDRAGLRPALGVPTGGAGSARILRGLCPRTPNGNTHVTEVL